MFQKEQALITLCLGSKRQHHAESSESILDHDEEHDRNQAQVIFGSFRLDRITRTHSKEIPPNEEGTSRSKVPEDMAEIRAMADQEPSKKAEQEHRICESKCPTIQLNGKSLKRGHEIE
jgi:hypothetical protein